MQRIRLRRIGLRRRGRHDFRTCRKQRDSIVGSDAPEMIEKHVTGV